MTEAISILAVTAATIGFFHTLLGPDHYLPFIVLSKARKWSLPKTMWITFLCGLGHVLSSVVLGLVGVAFGMALGRLEAFEAFRGNLAARALIVFGFTYCVWGLHRALKGRAHHHSHPHPHGEKGALTPWVLFTIFVLGPCEPLIPLVMYPAAEHSIAGTVVVAGIFSVVTVATMMAVVLVTIWGISLVKLGTVERFSHALAGLAICLSGLAIEFLGL